MLYRSMVRRWNEQRVLHTDLVRIIRDECAGDDNYLHLLSSDLLRLTQPYVSAYVCDFTSKLRRDMHLSRNMIEGKVMAIKK